MACKRTSRKRATKGNGKLKKGCRFTKGGGAVCCTKKKARKRRRTRRR